MTNRFVLFLSFLFFFFFVGVHFHVERYFVNISSCITDRAFIYKKIQDGDKIPRCTNKKNN